MTDSLTGEIMSIVVFVAILPYSQYIYAEGMLSTKEPQWIEVNNHALDYFGSVPALVVCDNCTQAVITNQDWIEPELNKDYADWADHYGTVILPAKIRKPKFKSSVENAVGILENSFFHKLEERQYFSLEQFNKDLWKELEALNKEPFKKKEHNRYYYWEEEKLELMPLPSMHYEYMERKTAKVSSYFHVNAILTSKRVEQRTYRSCMGLLKLTDKYSEALLEAACKKALSYTASPSYKSIKNILVTGSVKTEPESSGSKTTHKAHGITRGADYYRK